MKRFVGRIVTVSDGAGWSVTVSNWGVAQSTRHQKVGTREGGPRIIPPLRNQAGFLDDKSTLDAISRVHCKNWTCYLIP
jgi:hypothetical protein